HLRPVAPALIQALKHPQPPVRLQAATVLLRMGPTEMKAAIPGLIDLLDEPDVKLRLEAVHALGKIGAEAKAALPALVELLDDPLVAHAAVQALTQLGPDAVHPIRETRSKEEARDRPGA